MCGLVNNLVREKYLKLGKEKEKKKLFFQVLTEEGLR